MFKNTTRALIVTRIIIIALSLIQIFGILPQRGSAGVVAACAIWNLLILKKKQDRGALMSKPLISLKTAIWKNICSLPLIRNFYTDGFFMTACKNLTSD